MKKIVKKFTIILNLIAATALLIAYSSVYISPAKFWIPAIVGLAYPYILFLNFVFILYWLFSTSRMALLSIAIILIGYSHLKDYFQLKSVKTDKKGIVVCSYNVKNFIGISDTVKKTNNVTSIMNYLRSKNPDIVCMQETNSASIKGFNPILNKKGAPDKNMQTTADQHDSPIIFSRYPIVKKGKIRFEETSNMIVFADIKIDEDTFRIYSCHLQSFRFTSQDINSLDEISIEDQEKNIKEFHLFGSKLKRAFIKRTEHANKLRENIDHCPYPVIVCGDFNDTPVSYTYRTVRGHDLKDAFVESGTGIGNSYLGRLPSFRIDYILHSSDFTGYNFTVDRVTYSDHYPVSCKLIRNTDPLN